MPRSDAERWDEKYRLEKDFWLDREPRRLLRSFVHLLPRQGRALDAACGVGVNALFLAQQGLTVLGFDISEYALRLGMARFKELGLPVEVAVVDLSNPWLPPECFEVITNFHFLERATLPVFRQALKSGGLLLFDTFTRAKNTIDPPSYYLETGELRASFQGFEILHYVEQTTQPSRSHGERGTAQLVARKP